MRGKEQYIAQGFESRVTQLTIVQASVELRGQATHLYNHSAYW